MGRQGFTLSHISWTPHCQQLHRLYFSPACVLRSDWLRPDSSPRSLAAPSGEQVFAIICRLCSLNGCAWLLFSTEAVEQLRAPGVAFKWKQWRLVIRETWAVTWGGSEGVPGDSTASWAFISYSLFLSGRMQPLLFR